MQVYKYVMYPLPIVNQTEFDGEESIEKGQRLSTLPFMAGTSPR